MGCFCCVINLEPFSGVLFLVGSCFKCINKLPFHFPLGNRTPCGFCLTVWTILIACSTGDQSQGRRGESVIRYNHSQHWAWKPLKGQVNMIMTSDSHIYFKQAQVSLIFYLTEREREREREREKITFTDIIRCIIIAITGMTKSPWKWQMIHTCIHFKWAQVSSFFIWERERGRERRRKREYVFLFLRKNLRKLDFLGHMNH